MLSRDFFGTLFAKKLIPVQRKNMFFILCQALSSTESWKLGNNLGREEVKCELLWRSCLGRKFGSFCEEHAFIGITFF